MHVHVQPILTSMYLHPADGVRLLQLPSDLVSNILQITPPVLAGQMLMALHSSTTLNAETAHTTPSATASEALGVDEDVYPSSQPEIV